MKYYIFFSHFIKKKIEKKKLNGELKKIPLRIIRHVCISNVHGIFFSIHDKRYSKKNALTDSEMT